MAEEFEEYSDDDITGEQEESPLHYEAIATEEPLRPDIDEELEYSGSSYSEEENEAGSVSDFKTLMNVLMKPLPNKRIEDVVSPARLSRIFPDNFLDKYAITVAMLVQEQDLYQPFDFLSMINHVQDVYSFGYEGRGISDILEAFGAVKDADVANAAKDLFS